jgi:(p)ppGpp synthase/HD superfamily hydrolase
MDPESRIKEGTQGEDRASFMRRFRLKITPLDMEKLDFAYEMAKYGHRNQFRESGARYFEHVRATAIILIDELGVSDVDVIIVALLHDMFEDSFLLTPNRVRITFGERVATIVAAVSKPKRDDPRFTTKQERHTHYFNVVKSSSPEAKLVKLADRQQNVRTLGSCSTEKQTRKVKETREIYLSLIADITEEYPNQANYLTFQFEVALAKLGE